MNETIKPQEFNPNAARPAGEPLNNQTVDTTELLAQHATLEDGTQISWGNSALNSEVSGVRPVEQSAVSSQVNQEQPRGNYDQGTLQELEAARNEQNYVWAGTAKVTEIAGQRLENPRVHHVISASDGPRGGDGSVDPYKERDNSQQETPNATATPIIIKGSRPPGGEPGSEVISSATVTPVAEIGKDPGVTSGVEATPTVTPTPTSQFEGLKESVKGGS
jgi:hypothetical protein